MFSYYGTKKKLAHLYPSPIHNTIIEPFAGAAQYSLYGDNWKKDVILFDTNPKIVRIWEYLIQAKSSDILNLPDIQPGQKVTDFNLSESERYLIGFCINPGSSCPKITASKRCKWNSYKRLISDSVHKVKHWKVCLGSYLGIENKDATWFIDPPYQKAGQYYMGHKQIDFKSLGNWCKDRLGQVIVCENQGADWLPFTLLTEHRGSMKLNTEVWYYKP